MVIESPPSPEGIPRDKGDTLQYSSDSNFSTFHPDGSGLWLQLFTTEGSGLSLRSSFSPFPACFSQSRLIGDFPFTSNLFQQNHAVHLCKTARLNSKEVDSA